MKVLWTTDRERECVCRDIQAVNTMSIVDCLADDQVKASHAGRLAVAHFTLPTLRYYISSSRRLNSESQKVLRDEHRVPTLQIWY